jgi:hypothetical protein
VSFLVLCDGPTGRRRIRVPKMPTLHELIVCDQTLEVYRVNAVHDYDESKFVQVEAHAVYWGTFRKGVPVPRKERNRGKAHSRQG